MKGSWFKIILVILSPFIQFSSSEELEEDRYLLGDAIPIVPPSFTHGSLNTLDRLMESVTKEERIVGVLEEKLKLLERESKLIVSYLKDYNESTRTAVKGLHNSTNDTPEGRARMIASSAVLAHRMTDRYTSTLAELQKLLSSEAYTENQRNINKTLEPEIIKLIKELEENQTRNGNAYGYSEENVYEEDILPVWPKFIDKFMSDLAFIHIHEVFGYYPEKIRRGLPVDTEYGGILNAKQCTSIGVHALSRKYFYIAIEWLEFAKTLLLSPTENDRSIPLDFVSSLLDIAIKEHNLGLQNKTTLDIAYYFIYPVSEGQKHSERIRAPEMLYNSKRLRRNVELNAMAQYNALCTGATLQTPEIQKTLKCFYEHKKHPYLHINPVKTEVLSEDPPLLQFYELLSNHSIEIIKKVAIPRAELSLLVGVDDNDLGETSKHRTSSGTFVRYEEVPKLYEHSEIISGLRLLNKSSEMAQVVEYTYGRYYTYHTDALEEEGDEEEQDILRETGDRVATMLYYVEPGVYGGDTPFCAAGVNAHPVRGSAILCLEEPEDRFLLFDGIPYEPPSFTQGILNTLDRLMEWATKEESIVAVLKKKLKLLEKESKLIDNYLKDYNESTRMAMKGLLDSTKNTSEGRARVIGSSAVLAHRMTDRYTSTLAELQKLLSSNAYTETQRNVDKILHPEIIKLMKELEENKTRDEKADDMGEEKVYEKEGLPVWPKPIDKFMSDLAFIHIHEVYGYFPEKLKYGGILTAKQCTSIGVHALSRKYYFVAIEWLELAKTLLLSPTEEDRSIPLDFVSSLINIAIKEHNIGLKTVRFIDIANYFVYPVSEGQPSSKRIRARQMIYGNSRLRKDIEMNVMSQYSALCSGATFQSPEIQKTLKCFYETKRHPYLYINPVKTEVLSEDPPLLQFYELLSNHSIEIIKKVAIPRAELSLLVGVDDDNLDAITRYRTSAGTFFMYEEFPKLYDHSEIVSGLRLLNRSSEMAQVVEYTYGRYYIYHTDALEDEGDAEDQEILQETGDRVATLLYYLEPGVYGGDTPFCAAGINAHPVRGSAILW
ncbi:unnamed protein product [Orchesella dallaii]|uniref:Prolyl 4-hydroxylase subunit alpha-2 n=1 Tax=Orchesella dallaii TaxID=48710 RepID=A0ABP1Q747_9HEXA